MTVQTAALPLVVTGSRARTWRDAGRRGSDRPDGKSIVYVDWGAADDIMSEIVARRNRPYNAARPHVAAALRAAGERLARLNHP